MSGSDQEPEKDVSAAEFVLRLLDGQELLEARRRIARDPEFAAEVTGWEERLGPWLDQIPAEAPAPEVWGRIQQAVAGAPETGNNVVAFERRVRFWRRTSLTAGAMAASLALIVGYQGLRDPRTVIAPQEQAASPSPSSLIAGLASEETDTALSVSYEEGSLLVTPVRVAQLTRADHQLWIIPAGGTPISIGLIAGNVPQRLPIPAALADAFRPAATIALSREPEGGSPTGQPTGPVVAAGALSAI